MSVSVDMRPFRERLKEAAKHAGVEYSQTAIARSLGASKQTVDQWMANGRPSAEMIYRIADRWKVDPRWLAIEEGSMLSRSAAADNLELSPKEEIILRYVRGLFSLQQRDLVEELRALFDANQLTRKELGQKPLTGVSNEAVERAFGQVPAPVRKGRKAKRRPGVSHEDPDPE